MSALETQAITEEKEMHHQQYPETFSQVKEEKAGEHLPA